MQPRPVEREDVEHLLGEIPEVGLTRVLTTGATTADLIEAYERLTQEDGRVVRHPSAAADRVRQLMTVIGDIWAAEEGDDDEHEPS